MAVAIEPQHTIGSALASHRVLPAQLAATVRAMLQDRPHRLLISTTQGEPLLEVSVTMPTSPRVLLCVLDGVDTIAEHRAVRSSSTPCRHTGISTAARAIGLLGRGAKRRHRPSREADTSAGGWCGEGLAELSSDPVDNVNQLSRAAAAVAARFPRAVPKIVASRP